MQQRILRNKRRRRSSVEIVMEEPLLNQETKAKKKKRSSSETIDEDMADQRYHCGMVRSDSLIDCIYLLMSSIVSDKVCQGNWAEYCYGSVLVLSSSVKRRDLSSSLEENRILRKLFNSSNCFGNSYGLSSSEMNSTEENGFSQGFYLREVGNFIQLTSSLDELAVNHSKSFRDIVNNNHSDAIAYGVNRPFIFSIQKIHDKQQYALYEQSLREKALKPNPNYQIDLKKIKAKFKQKILHLANGIQLKAEDLDDILPRALIQSALEALRNGLLEPISNVKKKSKRRRRSNYYVFSSEAKAFCIDLIVKEGFAVDEVSKLCDVPPKSLKRWLAVGSKRKKGCGRKIRDPSMEEKLIEWYNDCVKSNMTPSPLKIRLKALELTDKKDFLASKGWLEKFKKKLKAQRH